MKLERLRQDFENAARKAAKWQARARELEKQITETGENTPPLRAEKAEEPRGAQEQHESKT